MFGIIIVLLKGSGTNCFESSVSGSDSLQNVVYCEMNDNMSSGTYILEYFRVIHAMENLTHHTAGFKRISCSGAV